MDNMHIYHYTKASSLPLILKSKKIRFTRADLLDDLTEVPYRNNQIDPCYYFVSSWTCKDGEMSGQWYRYADKHRGIRLQVSKELFEWHTLNIDFSNDGYGIKLLDVTTPYNKQSMFGNGYILCPDWYDMRSSFGQKLIYSDDPEIIISDYIKVLSNSTTINGPASMLARIKSKGWEDQEEYRFVLFAHSAPKIDYVNNPALYEKKYSKMLSMKEGKLAPPDVSYIDIPFSETVLENIEIIVGSAASSSDIATIESAIAEYAPKAKLQHSSLSIS